MNSLISATAFCSVLASCTCWQAGAATLILDTFDQGGGLHDLQTGTSRVAVGLPLASFRSIDVPGRGPAPGATLTVDVITGSGTLAVNFYDPANTGGRQQELYIMHTGLGTLGPPPYSLSAFEALEFDFSGVEGEANLFVYLGSLPAVFGGQYLRIPITNGTLSYSFDALNFSVGNTIDQFQPISYVIEMRSPEFRATLGEIRAVPEPGSVVLLVLVASSGLLHRRRTAWAG